MSRTTRIAIGIIVVVAIAAVAVFGFVFSQGSGDPSQDISQVVSTLPPTLTREAVEPTSEPTSEATDETSADATAEAATAEATADTSAASGNTDEGGEAVVFAIVAEESEARFIIDEILVGQPKEVVGVTNQVGGQMLIDFNNPSASQIGEIVVNVRTFTTDNEMRNRSIRSMILQTNNPENEFARFQPTALNGLPESITFGTPIEFTITGNLTLKGTTNSVTFDATVTPVSTERIEGLVTLTIDYESDFGIVISQLPMQVASVEDTVRLELEFVAAPVTE